MIFWTKTLSTEVKDNYRIIKHEPMKNDVRTSDEIAPFGYDGNPLKDMVAVYLESSMAGEDTVIGYINKSRLAATGESRLYSLDSTGAVKTYVWAKNDGTLLLGGDTDNAVRYSTLNTHIQNVITKINTELGKIATAIAAVGGSYTVATITESFTSAKINEIKTP